MEVFASEEGIMRTVNVGYVARRNLKSLPYKSANLEVKTVAVQQLVLLVPAENIGVEENK